MRVLFDTNVYVSEALVGGLAERLIQATLKARGRIFASRYLIEEIERALIENLGFSTRSAALARERATRRTELIRTPASRHRVLADPKDSPTLRAALAGG